MNIFHALIFTLFTLVLSPLVDAQVKNAAGKNVKPDSIYLSGYTALSEAERLEKNEQFEEAWNKYHQALRYFKTININYPKWNQALVARRLKSTTDKINEIEPLASKEHIASQEKQNQYLKSNTSESGIPSPDLPKISTNSNSNDKAKSNRFNRASEQAAQRAAEIRAQEERYKVALQKERDQHTAESNKLNKEISTLQDQLRRATQGLTSENTQTKTLNDQINKLRLELQASKKQSTLTQQKQLETLDRLTRERTMLATAPLKLDIERLTQEKQRFEAELDSIVGIHKKLLTSHLKTKEDRDKLTNEIQLLQTALNEKNKALENARKAGNQIVAGLREQIKAQSLQISNLTDQLIAVNKENEDLRTQLAHADEINKELGQHLASVTLERDKLSELIDLNDADRTKKTIQEALRLGEELRSARDSIKQLQANQNAAQDEIIMAENKLAVAKKKIIDLQSVNTNYIRRIGSLENSLRATKEQLDERVVNSSNDPLQKQEVAMLKKALQRITTQLERRKQAEALLVAEYQKADIQNAGLSSAIINLTDNELELTARESKLLKDKAITDSFSLNSGGISEEERIIAQTKSKNQIESLESIASRLVEKGSLQAAKEIFDEAYDAHGHHYPFFINRGVVRTQLGEYQEAEEIFESAAQLRENNAYTHFMLGFSRYKNNKDELAKKSLETAIHIRPDYVDAYNFLGNIAYASGENTKAKEYLTKAVSIDPDNIEAYFNLSNVLLALGENEAAIEAYNDALRSGLPPNFDYEKRLGIDKKVGKK